MADIPFPRGVRDLMPNEALFRNELLNTIEASFQRFGYLSIDTPAFESLKVLNAKDVIGEEAKLLYEMKFEDIGLRYDQTVSLARYMAMHQSLPMPFKRYMIGKAWRREEPQKLRYREFTQADIDIVGSSSPAADAEVIAVPGYIFESLGLPYKILINDRKFVDGILGSLQIKPEMRRPVMRAVDKLDKIGRDGVLESLTKLGIERDVLAKLDSLFNLQGGNEEKLSYLEKLVTEKEEIAHVREVLSILSNYNLKGTVELDFSLMRGLDYYTGMVFEFKLENHDYKGTICGGGRYDNLIGVFAKKSMPAVGSSIGVDRLLDLLGFSSSMKYTYAQAFIVNVAETNYMYALRVANTLRANGIAVELNSAKRNISNQLAYANSLKFPFAIIIGDAEEKLTKVKLRNLITGTEASLALKEAIDIIKKGV
jgi:histidyl-tRNA synthetase